jgi:hypothetical protein
MDERIPDKIAMPSVPHPSTVKVIGDSAERDIFEVEATRKRCCHVWLYFGS